MRKLIMLLMMLIVSQINFAQLSKIDEPKIIAQFKIAPMGLFLAERTVYVDGVRIMFRNIEYKQIIDIKSFNLTTEDDLNLSKLLLSENNKSGDKYSLKTIDGGELYIRFETQLGATYPLLYYINNGIYYGIQYMTNRQLKKLFNVM